MIDVQKYISSKPYFSVISDIANDIGIDVYIVGGYIRDLILNRTLDDVDILVIGDGLEFAEKLGERFGVKNISLFKNFRTAHFKYQGIEFEFVGARKESYSIDSRNPEVEVGTFDDDIDRRDFTINSIALSLNMLNFGDIIDKYNGIGDIKKQLIKTPLNPKNTFNDDPLRIMRAFRFAAQLGFKLDEQLFEAARDMAERLEIISRERITDEFMKILASPKPSIGLKLLYNSGAMKYVFPEVANLGGVVQKKDFHHKDVFLHTCKVVDNIAAVSDNVWLRFAGLVHDIAKPKTKRFDENIGWTFHGHEEIGARMMKSIFRKMKLPFSTLDSLRTLVRLHLRPIALVSDNVTDSAIRRFIVAIGEDLEDMIVLCRADITSKNPEKVNKYLNNYDKVMKKVRDVKEKDKLRAFQSPVRGEEIMKICNLPPSKQVGEIKSSIEDAILDGKIENSYEAAYAYLLEIKDKFKKN